MRYVDLQASFELEINQIDANLTKPKSIDIEYWLNKGLEKFYKTRYLEFEQNQKRLDDLRTLVRTKHFDLDENSWLLVKEDNSHLMLDIKSDFLLEEASADKILVTRTGLFFIKLPHDYMFLLGDRSGIVPTKQEYLNCVKYDEDGDIVPYYDDTIEATVETIDKQYRNSLSEHKIKHNRARPLRIIQDDQLILITDGNYKVQEYQLTYLRKPNNIDIHKYPYDEYTDMPEHTHGEIVKLAVQMYLENQTSNRYNTYTNEVSTME